MIFNNDKYKVYYKPEESRKDKNPEKRDWNENTAKEFVVESGKISPYPIDGVATSLHKDMVFKIPDEGRVEVTECGYVNVLDSKTNLIPNISPGMNEDNRF